MRQNQLIYRQSLLTCDQYRSSADDLRQIYAELHRTAREYKQLEFKARRAAREMFRALEQLRIQLAALGISVTFEAQSGGQSNGRRQQHPDL